jgi:formylglycine-generating enzyme required for sulfatase activity
MHGNVWECCQDWYGEYPADSLTDPSGPEFGAGRVLRGGSWRYTLHYCRSAIRDHFRPDLRSDNVGFVWRELKT